MPTICDSLKSQMQAIAAEIASLQAELQEAPPGRKAMLVAQIKQQKSLLNSVKSQFSAQGCAA